jgi:phage terminase small subunit
MIPEIAFKEDLEIVGQLKPEMLMFISAIVGGAKPSDAAVRAGLRPSAGYRLAKMPEVIEAIIAERERELKEFEVTEERVLQRLAMFSFVDKRDFYNEDGTCKNIQELSEEAASCITSIDVEELWEGRGENREQVGRVLKYRFESPKGALELLGRFLKLWTDRIEVSGTQELAERLRKARASVAAELPEANAELTPSRE